MQHLRMLIVMLAFDVVVGGIADGKPLIAKHQDDRILFRDMVALALSYQWSLN